MTTPDLADHTHRVRSELERYRPASERWQAARDLAIAAINCAILPNSDNAERTQDQPEPEPAPTLERWAETFAVEHSEAKRLRPGTIREQPWVFTRELAGDTTNLSRSALSWRVMLAERDVGLAQSESDGQLHKLRHTYITRLAAAGVPARTIMDLAGHRQLSTTMRYMHLIPGATATGVAALERFDHASAARLRQDGGREESG